MSIFYFLGSFVDRWLDEGDASINGGAEKNEGGDGADLETFGAGWCKW